MKTRYLAQGILIFGSFWQKFNIDIAYALTTCTIIDEYDQIYVEYVGIMTDRSNSSQMWRYM